MSGIGLRLKVDGLTGRNARLWLDGHEITNGLTGLTLRVGVNDVNTAEIKILVDSIEADADTLAALTACVEQPKEEVPA